MGRLAFLLISFGYHQPILTTSEWEAGFPLMCILTCSSKERCPTISRVILPRDLLSQVPEGQRDRQASAAQAYASCMVCSVLSSRPAECQSAHSELSKDAF